MKIGSLGEKMFDNNKLKLMKVNVDLDSFLTFNFAPDFI